MTTDPQLERIVRSWLEPGLTTLTDDVLDAVMNQLPATPQRRRWSPARRVSDMSAFAKFAVAAAAVLAVALVGYNLLAPGGASDIGGVAPSSPPSPSPTVSSVQDGDLDPGTYRSEISGGLTFTVPTGWTGSTNQFVTHKGETDAGTLGRTGHGFDSPSGVTLTVWELTHVYADSCDWMGTLVEAGTPAALAEALAAQRGHETAGPTELTLGGYPATRFEFSIPSSFKTSDCYSDFIRLWPGPGPNEDAGLPISPGQTTTVYVVDVEGKGRVVGAIQRPESSAEDVAELDAVVQSLQFEP